MITLENMNGLLPTRKVRYNITDYHLIETAHFPSMVFR